VLGLFRRLAMTPNQMLHCPAVGACSKLLTPIPDPQKKGLGRHFGRRLIGLKGKNLRFQRTAVCAVEVLDRNIVATWMGIDGALHDRLGALGTGFIEKQHQRHGEFLSPPGELSTSKGPNLDC